MRNERRKVEWAAALAVAAMSAVAAGCTVTTQVTVPTPAPSGAGVSETEYRHVRIRVGDAGGKSDPRCGEGAVGTIEVEPFIATIFVPGDGERPRQVRWVAEGLEEGDLLFIRPTKGSSKRLFRPETGGVFTLPSASSPSVASGRPVQPRFDKRSQARIEERTVAALPHRPSPSGEFIAWRYEIEVERNGERRLYCDPEIMMERDG